MKKPAHPRPFAFCKFSGSGNDFVVVDHRERWCADPAELARQVCRRGQSIGADGLILIEPAAAPAHFTMRIINADGSEAEMCGNGARCAARFAFLEQLAPASMQFVTGAGIVDAVVNTDETVKISLAYDVRMELNTVVHRADGALRADVLNTGVPHLVVAVDDLGLDSVERVDVAALGRELRHHAQFQPAGTNVNFVQQVNAETIRVRTFERGVEGETLACGTGSVASAIATAIRNEMRPPVTVVTRGGDRLIVHFRLTDAGVSDLHLQGGARLVYRGQALEYR